MSKLKLKKQKNKKLLLGTKDCTFKAVLLDPDNPDYLKGFIHLITGIPLSVLENIEIRNVEHMIKNKKDKIMRSDIIVSVGKMYINIELNKKKNSWLFNRNDNYMQNIASNFYNVKESYLSEYKMIQINFDCFSYLETEKAVSKLVYKEYDTNELDPNYENSIKYHVNLDYIKKTCYNKNVEELSTLERYCLLLMSETKEEIKKFAGDDIVMKKVRKRIEVISSDEKMIGLYDAEIEEEKIRRSIIEEAQNEGFEKGIEQGIEQRNIEIAKKMLKKGYTIDSISDVTGLSLKEIEELSAK